MTRLLQVLGAHACMHEQCWNQRVCDVVMDSRCTNGNSPPKAEAGVEVQWQRTCDDGGRMSEGSFVERAPAHVTGDRRAACECGGL